MVRNAASVLYMDADSFEILWFWDGMHCTLGSLQYFLETNQKSYHTISINLFKIMLSSLS